MFSYISKKTTFNMEIQVVLRIQRSNFYFELSFNVCALYNSIPLALKSKSINLFMTGKRSIRC